MKRVTLDDIVKNTGYSKATVSRALTKTGTVGREARIRIVQEANRLGYITRCRNVAVIMPYHYYGDYFGLLATHLSRKLCEYGFRPVFLNVNDLEILDELRVDGVFSVIPRSGFEKLWSRENIIPLVCINTKPFHVDGIFMAASNERQGCRILIEALVKAGHRKILRLSHETAWDNSIMSSDERTKVFNEMASVHGIESCFCCCGREMIAIFNALKNVWKFEPTAILVESEQHYKPLVHLLTSLGVSIPNDISLASWAFPEDLEEMQYEPTCIFQDVEGIANSACRMLSKMIDGNVLREDILVNYIYHEGRSISVPNPSGSPLRRIFGASAQTAVKQAADGNAAEVEKLNQRIAVLNRIVSGDRRPASADPASDTERG